MKSNTGTPVIPIGLMLVCIALIFIAPHGWVLFAPIAACFGFVILIRMGAGDMFLSLSDKMAGFSMGLGRLFSFMILPLIFLIMFDVITRKIDFIKDASADITIEYGYSVSFILQDLQWHAHGMLLLMTFGFAYLLNAHVRVDIFRENAGRRGQAWVELCGLFICAVPFLMIMIYFSWNLTYASWMQGEGSESQVGLGWRYIIKSFLVWGFAVALIAALATLFRVACFLFGTMDQQAEAEDKLQFFTDADEMSKLILEENARTESAQGGH